MKTKLEIIIEVEENTTESYELYDKAFRNNGELKISDVFDPDGKIMIESMDYIESYCEKSQNFISTDYDIKPTKVNAIMFNRKQKERIVMNNELNLYQVIIDFNRQEKYIVAEDIVTALKNAQNKYEHDIIGIEFIEKNVE